MKNTGRKNQFIKIIASSCLVLFSTITCVLTTVCWFMSRHEVEETNEMIVFAQAGFLKQITVHHYLGLDDDRYIFNKNYETKIYADASGGLVYEGIENLSLGTYTPFEREHPALVLIELEKPLTNNDDALLSMKIGTESEYLGKTNADGTLVRKIAQSGNPMSSVIKFCGTSFSNQTELESCFSTFEENESIEMSKDSFGETKHFVDIASDGGSYTNYEYEKDAIDFGHDDVVLYMAIVIDYYEASMEYIYGLNIGNPVLSNMESNVGFRCDWILSF